MDAIQSLIDDLDLKINKYKAIISENSYTTSKRYSDPYDAEEKTVENNDLKNKYIITDGKSFFNLKNYSGAGYITSNNTLTKVSEDEINLYPMNFRYEIFENAKRSSETYYLNLTYSTAYDYYTNKIQTLENEKSTYVEFLADPF